MIAFTISAPAAIVIRVPDAVAEKDMRIEKKTLNNVHRVMGRGSENAAIFYLSQMGYWDFLL